MTQNPISIRVESDDLRAQLTERGWTGGDATTAADPVLVVNQAPGPMSSSDERLLSPLVVNWWTYANLNLGEPPLPGSVAAKAAAAAEIANPAKPVPPQAPWTVKLRAKVTSVRHPQGRPAFLVPRDVADILAAKGQYRIIEPSDVFDMDVLAKTLARWTPGTGDEFASFVNADR